MYKWLGANGFKSDKKLLIKLLERLELHLKKVNQNRTKWSTISSWWRWRVWTLAKLCNLIEGCECIKWFNWLGTPTIIKFGCFTVFSAINSNKTFKSSESFIYIYILP